MGFWHGFPDGSGNFGKTRRRNGKRDRAVLDYGQRRLAGFNRFDRERTAYFS